jgi:cytochrome c-type biogenesis protein CcmH/NrfG
MTLKYYYLSVVLLCFAIGGYLFGVGLYQEPAGEEPAVTALRTADSQEAEPPASDVQAVPVAPATAAEPVIREEAVGGPFPADVLPPEARLGTSSQPVVLE